MTRCRDHGPLTIPHPGVAPPVPAVCTIELDNGAPCGKPAAPGAPVDICAAHTLTVFRYAQNVMNDAATETETRIRDISTMWASRGWCDPMNGWPAVVYYVESGGQIKIGTSVALTGRMKEYPPNARLLAVEPGSFQVEKRRHQQFGHLRAARKEWFSPGPELVEHIGELAAAGLMQSAFPDVHLNV